MKEGSFVHRLFLFGLVLLEVGCTYSDAQCSPASGGVKRFGAKCQFRCHCLDGEQCNFETGACQSECSYNWTGPFCQYKNIALEVESRHSDNKQPPQYSKLANDRDIKSCSSTADPTTSRNIAPWWAIWFSHDVVFNELVFTTKEEYLKYFPDFNVTVQKDVTEDDHRRKKVHEGELCYRQNKTIQKHSTVNVKCTTELTGNQLRLQLANTSTQLVICDLRISGGCPGKTWGEDCTKECGFCYGLSKCDYRNGSCAKCEVGYKPMPTCTEECEDGYFGKNCSNNCGTNCRKKSGKKLCHHVSGICLHGCNAGWQGDLCETECDDGFFGVNCSQDCGTNCMNSSQENVCHHVNGTCLHGCKAGWKGGLCETKCEDGFYGINCNQTCGMNCMNSSQENICHHVYGICLHGCNAGWKGNYCEAECGDGYYGMNCSQNCGTNCQNNYQENFCHHVSGACLQGCKAGWQGVHCEAECENGVYGVNCSKNCGANCMNSSEENICHHENGTCLQGCNAGWQGDHCEFKCKNGVYGVNCSQNCGTNCMNSSEENVCHHVNGTCLHGCNAGWQGDHCESECNEGTYGNNCINSCDKNCKNGVCHKETGECIDGCKPGYTGHKCEQGCKDGLFGNNCSQECGNNCQKKPKELICHHENGTCFHGCKAGWQGELCQTRLNQMQDTYVVAAVVGGISAAIVLGIIIIVAFLLPRRRCKGLQNEKHKPDNKKRLIRGNASDTLEPIQSKDIRPNQENLYINASELVEQHNHECSGGTNASSQDDIEMTYMNENQSEDTSQGHEVPISELEAYVKSGFDHEQYFFDQFQKIPYGMQYPSVAATKPENIGKNKYKAMYAYDHSRVVLKMEPGETGTDYVNASHIKGYSCRKSYIAAQGPIDSSQCEFWRMIWEQNIRTIVMATNVIEEGKTKCKQYWPSVGETAQNGKIVVFLESEDTFTEFTIRHLKVYHEDRPARQRSVTQFHFRAWPDKGVPRGTSGLLHFWYQVRKHNSDKKPPWLVHCSAGVGRTGTFIAIDILYDQGMDMGSIDVFKCVSDLREQRVNMVQTKEQYKFVHSVMVEALVKPWKPVHIDQFSSFYDELKNVDKLTGKTKFLLQYETLNDGLVVGNGEETKEDTVIAAKKTENRHKNRYDNIFAPNEFRPFLYTPVNGCTDYINAVYIPGYRMKHDFIITQTPLTITAVDWFRLIIEEEVKFVVAFEDHDKTEVAEYLPKTGTKTIGPFTVRFENEGDRSYVTQRNYEIKYQTKMHQVSVLVCKCWLKSKLTPSDPNEMLRFLQELEQLKKQTNGAPLLVQCLNGAERSGLIVVLMNIIERVWYDTEVSIVQVIRQMKIIRQQIIPNFEQFKFCHDVLLSHTQYSSTYANM